MTKIEVSRYRAVLESKLKELAIVVRNRAGIAIEKNAEAMDEVQGAAARELAIRNLDRDSKLLRHVRGALARIDDGTLGICLRCDQDINRKRLDAVPWAPFCLTCQEWADQEADQEDESGLFESHPAMVL